MKYYCILLWTTTVYERLFLPVTGQFTSLIAAMAVVATVCLVGVSYFAWDKKKRSAGRGYQLLRVSTEN